MGSVTRKKSSRRLLLPEQETRLLRSDLFRLFGQEKTYCRLVTDVLRPKWRETEFPDDHPGRFEFDALRDLARDQATDPALKSYVGDVEYVVSMTLHINNKDKKPAEWAAQFFHSAVAPPAHVPAGLEFVPGGIYRWDTYDLPAGIYWDYAFIAIQVSPAGAQVHAPLQEPIDVPCEAKEGKSEWLSFNRWDRLSKTAHQALDRELEKLRWAVEQRYETSWRNRKAFDKDRRDVLPALFRLLFHEEPPPKTVSRGRLRELAKRMEIDLPRKPRKRQKT